MLEKIVLVIDSGLGGLTFIDEVINYSIGGNYLYIGDTKNAPYGEKSVEKIREELLKLIARVSLEYQIEKVIFACNTAAVSAQKYLEEKFPFEFESVVDVTIESFMGKKGMSVDWLATPTTIKTEFLSKRLTSLELNGVPCQPFVPLIESENFENEKYREVVVKRTLIKEKADLTADFVILGCTHYPYLLKELKNTYSKHTVFFNPSLVLASKLKKEKADEKNVTIKFFQTGESAYFEKIVEGKYAAEVGLI